MRKWILLFSILGLISFNPVFAQNEENDYCCAFYFTFIGCPNCAVVDPIVLVQWTEKYPNLVIIEYAWHARDWQNPNSQFFGKYAKAYNTQAAVPQLVFNKKNIKLGRIDVPNGEEYIKTKNSNFCPLIDKSVSFKELNLEKLQAFPKIWANGRVLIKEGKDWIFQWNGESPPKTIGKERFGQKELKELLFTENIFESLKGKIFDIVEPQKVEFSGSAFPKSSGFVPYAEFQNAIKITLSETLPPSQPNENQKLQKENDQKLEEEIIKLPFVGKIETKNFSLPILTFLIALADGFNPCAFFVLTFLLAALIGLAGARKKILLVGGVFIFFSALFYFLFMSVLLNVFQLGGKVAILTIIAGLIAVFAGLVNIKDYFYFQKGISLTLPKGHKERFLAKVKNLSLAKSTMALVSATAIIAATVNVYELLCTFGFPMVYTRILTLRELSSFKYYLYLIFYNLVYILPLGGIVLIFAVTLGRKTFSQLWVRRLKLVSGFMILFLGLSLILKPKLLESIFTAFLIMLGAIIISGTIIFFHSFYKKHQSSLS